MADMTCDLAFVLTRPSDRTKVGTEALQMVDWEGMFDKVGRRAMRRFEDVVREGFAANFAAEGTPGEPWAPLAEWTQNDREQMAKEQVGALVPGFTPTHPILQRTGDYKQSWVDAEDGDALLFLEPQGPGDLFVYIGSQDDRVEELSSGVRQSGSAQFTEQQVLDMDLDLTPTESGSLPPRPVHKIGDQFEETLRQLGESWGKLMADMAKTK